MSLDDAPVYTALDYAGQICPITTAALGDADISIMHVDTGQHWWAVRYQGRDVAEGEATSQPQARAEAEAAARAAQNADVT